MKIITFSSGEKQTVETISCFTEYVSGLKECIDIYHIMIIGAPAICHYFAN